LIGLKKVTKELQIDASDKIPGKAFEILKLIAMDVK
jgi:hypothetical protein